VDTDEDIGPLLLCKLSLFGRDLFRNNFVQKSLNFVVDVEEIGSKEFWKGKIFFGQHSFFSLILESWKCQENIILMFSGSYK